jgi:hypothetical protein
MKKDAFFLGGLLAIPIPPATFASASGKQVQRSLPDGKK